jgi:general secretion pathway protein F
LTLYHYKAAAPGGELVEGEMEAPDRASVARALHQHAYTPIRIAEGKEPPPSALDRLRRRLSQPIGSGVARREIDRMPEGLATLLQAGVPLDEALAILAEAAAKQEAAALFRRVRDRVRMGRPLSAALAAERGRFDAFAIALTQAGEVGGRLDAALGALAAYRARAHTLADSVRSALVYPMVLVGFGALSVIALMIFVIPEFERLFREGGRDLPLFTKAVFGIAGLLRDWSWLIIIVLAGLSWWGLHKLSDPAVRRRFDRHRLDWPIYGRLRLLFDSERLARALGALLANGVDLPSALSLAGRTLGNQALAAGIAEAAAKVRQGAPLADTIGASGPWPPALTRMIRVGMETGRLAPLCNEAADIFGREAEARAKRLVALLEPALIIGIGIVVAAIILAVLTAIVGLNALAL